MGLLTCVVGAVGWQWVERQQQLDRERKRSEAAARAVEQARRATERAMAEQGRPAVERARQAAVMTRSAADQADKHDASTPSRP